MGTRAERDQELDDLLARAREADGLTRISLRDPIAAFGVDAIEAMVPWAEGGRLAAFAVRVEVIGPAIEADRRSGR